MRANWGCRTAGNNQPCHEMAVVSRQCRSASCGVFPRNVRISEDCDQSRCLLAGTTSDAEPLHRYPGQLGPGDKRLTPTPDSVRPLRRFNKLIAAAYASTYYMESNWNEWFDFIQLPFWK